MKMIAAADSRWSIGKDGKLLISIPADMKFFRETTSGCTVIMGRKTLESFPGGRPLKNRRNIVLTRQEDYCVDGAEVCHSVEEVLEAVRGDDPEKVFVIGGESIYREMLKYCDTALITRIDHIYDADTVIPNLDEDPEWELAYESEEQFFFDLTYHFRTYRRK